jgi:hypothetical protein
MEELKIKPTGEFIQQFVDNYEDKDFFSKWNMAAAYALVDKIQENKTYEEVYTKMVFINGAFKTRIGDIDGVVKQFYKNEMLGNNIDVDKMLKSGDPELVDKIANCYKTKKEKARVNYSFATKFCHCHKRNLFPIFDSYVEASLVYFKEKYRFSKFSKKAIKKNYKEFIRVFQDFKKFANAESLDNQVVDRFLWVLGRDLVPPKTPKKKKKKQ